MYLIEVINMRMVDIITKKRDGHTLNEEEICFFVNGYVKGEIPDYQASALAMAIVFQGMSNEEICILTDAMEHSGDTIDLSMIKGVKVDKHSTGGVGDKTSLVLGPLVASCGAKIAKMRARGLGHTGGTLDKMESLAGMNINISGITFTNTTVTYDGNTHEPTVNGSAISVNKQTITISQNIVAKTNK